MCNKRTLTHSNNGYIAFCNRCHNFQFAFGTVLITMNEEEYSEFCDVAGEQFRENENSGLEFHKTIQLPAFSKNVLVLISFAELKIVMQMLNEAAIMKEIDALLIRQNS